MIEALSPQESEEIALSFRRIWKVAVVFAVISAPLVMWFKDRYPLVIAFPIVAGVLTILFLELRERFPQSIAKTPGFSPESARIQELENSIALLAKALEKILSQSGPNLPVKMVEKLLSSQDESFRQEAVRGLLSFSGDIALEVRPRSDDPDQTLMPFLHPDKTKNRKERVEVLEGGEKIIVVTCDRFIDLLVSDLIPDSDKIVQASMLAASKKFKNMVMEDALKSGALTKAVLEILKAEFRGNWITAVSRHGEKVIRKIEKNLGVEDALASAEK